MMIRVALFLALTMLSLPAQAEEISLVERKVYLQQCVGKDDKMKAYCECSLEQMQKRMSVQEFRDLGKLPQDKIMNNKKFSDSVIACSDKLK